MRVIEKGKAVESIRRIQLGLGSYRDFELLELATGNQWVWTVFHELELEGFLPEKLFTMLCVNGEIPGSKLEPITTP